jgi:hypothetical protein
MTRMYDTIFLIDILKNPVLLAALIALIRNMGGYIYNSTEAKKLLPYQPSQLITTLGIYETVFLSLSAVPSIPVEWMPIVAVVVDIVRSFRKAIELAFKDAIATQTKGQ